MLEEARLKDNLLWLYGLVKSIVVSWSRFELRVRDSGLVPLFPFVAIQILDKVPAKVRILSPRHFMILRQEIVGT